MFNLFMRFSLLITFTLKIILAILVILIFSCSTDKSKETKECININNSKASISNIHIIIDYSYSMRGFGSGNDIEGSGSIYAILSRLRELAQDCGAKIVVHRTGNLAGVKEPIFEKLGEY